MRANHFKTVTALLLISSKRHDHSYLGNNSARNYGGICLKKPTQDK